MSTDKTSSKKYSKFHYSEKIPVWKYLIEFIDSIHLVQKCLMSIYYVPGTILGTRDTTIRHTKMPALWSLDSSADILDNLSDTLLVCYSICECCIG